ncbi:hypothetical protein [Nesterenkonia rhizosphaerae]|uniref:Uncharacterized protein n=1 Tax=Nesterenkonia rhizosphaerae TaxID=1348272 RepID=A0ABP9FZH6_9MICC
MQLRELVTEIETLLQLPAPKVDKLASARERHTTGITAEDQFQAHHQVMTQYLREAQDKALEEAVEFLRVTESGESLNPWATLEHAQECMKLHANIQAFWN